ncbi:MAG: hypothetical protein J5994_10530 [Ruminococcus sp.]|nr:hypothetical protein [Ruminococcus sp.]
MKLRSLLLLSVLFTSSIVLSSCACKHEKWIDATCTKPKTCAECGITEGSPLSHQWIDATCSVPKTCSLCNETEGEPLEHKWINATCSKPKTCYFCGKTEGEPSEHDWEEANCVFPKRCSVCGVTEGEKSDHNWKKATCTEPKTCKVCGKTTGQKQGHKWKDATCIDPKTCSVCKETIKGTARGHAYKNGYCVRCDEKDPNYVSPSDITTLAQLQDYLNKNYSKIETPFGTITDITFEIDEVTELSRRQVYPYDFYIQTSANLYIYKPTVDIPGSASDEVILLPYDMDNVNVTDQQRADMVAAMKNYQSEIANVAMTAFPNKKIAGGFYNFNSSGWYNTGDETDPDDWHYSDGSSTRYFTWINYDGDLYGLSGSYDDSYISQFHWSEAFDDIWYGYND